MRIDWKMLCRFLINNIYFIWRWNLPHLLTWKYMHKQCGLKIENHFSFIVRQTSKTPQKATSKINIFGNTEIFFTLQGSFRKHFKQIQANGTTVFLNCKYNFWISCSHSNDSHQCPILTADLLWDKKWTAYLYPSLTSRPCPDGFFIFCPIIKNNKVSCEYGTLMWIIAVM